MSCPYFYPNAPCSDATTTPARAPLGVLYDGLCYAEAAHPRLPVPGELHEACNFGYGRARCPSFPPNAEADAVRFTPAGAEILYVLEKDCAPVGFGRIEELSNLIMIRQAEVFQASWRSKA
jgi:hypothetical protein